MKTFNFLTEPNAIELKNKQVCILKQNFKALKFIDYYTIILYTWSQKNLYFLFQREIVI
jgi:hypothetical protein